MLIPLIIGRNSMGEFQQIDLADVPLLMISYCEVEQLKSIYAQLSISSYPFKQKDFYITSINRCKIWNVALNNDFTYFKDEPEKGNIQSKFIMLKSLNDEINNRERILKTKKITDFKKYYSLNTWKSEKLAYQFFILDDIWDIVISKPKSLGLSLMRIILYGPSVGIHTIFTSSISFRNLLQQLININPRITKELQKKYGIPEPNVISNLGNELIITAENLVFYKKAGKLGLEKLYPTL